MKGCIFDLDGTLLDSMPSWQNLLHNLLLSRGITPPDDLLDRTKTVGLESATGMILKEFNLQDDPALVYQMFQQTMAERYCSTIPLKPGVQEYLDKMMAARVPMAVATATARPLVEKVLAHHHLTDYFQCITTVAEVGIGKHDPRIYLATASKMGIPPQQCVVFEDSLAGIRSAKAAGFTTVAIYEETNPVEQQALLQEADTYIHDFRNLMQLNDDILE